MTTYLLKQRTRLHTWCRTLCIFRSILKVLRFVGSGVLKATLWKFIFLRAALDMVLKLTASAAQLLTALLTNPIAKLSWL